MSPEQLERSLREHLRSHGTPLKPLGAADVLRIAADHWASTQVDGVWPDEGDGLVAYFELLYRGRGLDYAFGVNWILRSGALNQEKPGEWHFQLVSSYRQRNSGIRFAACDVPPDAPRHATKELTWAVA